MGIEEKIAQAESDLQHRKNLVAIAETKLKELHERKAMERTYGQKAVELLFWKGYLAESASFFVQGTESSFVFQPNDQANLRRPLEEMLYDIRAHHAAAIDKAREHAAAEEREACAKLASSYWEVDATASAIANAIRFRAKKDGSK